MQLKLEKDLCSHIQAISGVFDCIGEYDNLMGFTKTIHTGTRRMQWLETEIRQRLFPDQIGPNWWSNEVVS